MVNMNPKTRIRYGVIPSRQLEYWYEDSLPDYPKETDDQESINWCGDPLGFYYMADGYKAYQTFDDPDVFITDSKYYTLCALCSPCAPNAGYLLQEGLYKAYCFAHDWFKDDKAPYKVYRVDNDEEVTDGF
jgi:hypothetical protein